MQFQVKGQEYFLTFAEDERRWYVVAPSPTGLQRLPVYVDAGVAPASVLQIGTHEASS